MACAFASTINNVPSDCFVKAAQYTVICQLYKHFYTISTGEFLSKAPDIQDIYKVAKAYEHDSFTHTVDYYTETINVANACIELTSAMVVKSDLYKNKIAYFNTLKTGKTIQITQHNDVTRILVDGKHKIAARQNAPIYIAWWHITHLCQSLVEKIITQLNAVHLSDTSHEKMYTLLTQVFDTRVFEEEAKQLQHYINVLLKI